MVAERLESVTDFETALKRIAEDDQYAFVWTSTSLDYVMSGYHANFTESCNISTIPNYELLPFAVSMFVQKDSQFTEMFNF